MPSSFDPITNREKGLQRSLTSAQLSMIAIGGAIGTGLFLGSTFAISFAGPAVLISYAIGALITLLLMGALAEMTAAHPTSGSFGAWAEFYLSPFAGFLVRYSYWSCVVLALGTEVSAVAIYMRFWFPAIPGIAWIIGFSATLVLVNGANVRYFGSVEYIFSSIKIFAIVIFLVLGAVTLATVKAPSVGVNNFSAHGGFFPHGISGVAFATIVALFSFFSVEMIAVAAGEAHDPQRAITHAFRATFLRLVLFYLLTLTIILALVPWTDLVSGAQAQSPFVQVMRVSHIPYAAGVMNFVILIAALSAMNSQLYITSRMLFSLARAGSAPGALGAISRSGVPLRALIVSTAGIALAALLNALYPAGAFETMLAVSVFGAMFVWLMIFLTHLAFRRKHLNEPLAFRVWGYPYTSILGALMMLAMLITTFFTPAFRPTLIYGLPFLALLSTTYYLLSRSKPRQR